MGKTKSSFAKKNSRKQKIYRMRGCSKTRKNYLGGSGDVPLAYTGKPNFSYPNPNLAYIGKGGSSCGLSNTSSIPINTNAANPAYPNTGLVSGGTDIIFNVAQRGGCGCSLTGMTGGRKNQNMKGGLCGANCALAYHQSTGGSKHKNSCSCNKCSKHRNGCLCTDCKNERKSGGMKGGNAGIPYPNGLVGSPWTPSVSGWPGIDGVSGDRNFLPQNLYNSGDPQTSMIDVGANPPFLYMKGGKKRNQKGGTLTNLMGQDLINLGRQFQFGIGSAYNALAGYQSPVNPMPWRDQFPNKIALSTSTI